MSEHARESWTSGEPARESSRGFPAFPAQRGRRGRSWWGRALVTAMEDTSRDPDLLRRSRRLADSGRIGPITLSPGRVGATVEDIDDLYEVAVRVAELTSDEWDRFREQVLAEPGHLAALLDGEVPRSLVRAADLADVVLLPEIGDLESACGCPDWGDPCEHAAALCYQTAWLLDADPFLLLLLRGRGKPELLDTFGRCKEEPAVATSCRVSPVPAAAAYARPVPPLPEPPPAAPRTTVVGPTPGLPDVDLGLLIVDAAERARTLARGVPPVLDPWDDAVRWAATYPQVAARVAANIGDSTELGPAARAWELGGMTALAVLKELRRPDGPRVEHVQAAPGAVACRGQDGHWYPFRRHGGCWWPAGPPDHDLDAALDSLPAG
ncbi:MAG: SWIM zinc finger family protein [Pseudonocardia sp.]